MKKFLQKTYTWLVMLVAMFAVSTSAMAQATYVEWDFKNGIYGIDSNGVIITSNGDDYTSNGGTDIYGSKRVTITCVESLEIYQVEMTFIAMGWEGVSSSSQCGQYIYEASSKGSITNNGSSITWTGTANSLAFGNQKDFLVAKVKAYYRAASGPVAQTFSFSSSDPSNAEVKNTAVYGITLYYGGQLSFAAGKSISDISVDGTPLSVGTYTDLSSTYVYFNAVCTDGDHVVEIPAGVFQNASSKTNEALTINFTVNTPGFTMTSAGWTTYCSNSTWTMPAGYEGYVVSDIVDGSAILTKFVSGNEDVSSYVSLLITGPESPKVVVNQTYGNPGYPAMNYLYSIVNLGQEVATTFYNYHAPTYCSTIMGGDSDCDLYKLSLDSEGKNLGFYWDSADGKSVTCQPNKAFLVVPASKASASNGLKIRFAEDEVTGINAIATESNDAIYNLQGQRVNANAAGVYVKNGKKFIVK